MKNEPVAIGRWTDSPFSRELEKMREEERLQESSNVDPDHPQMDESGQVLAQVK